MTRRTRISLISLLLGVSAVYATLIAIDPDFAREIMMGYIGAVLTIFGVNELWKRS